jgi:hypothetical protein
MHYLLNLEKFKIYIRIQTNIAPTCFGLSTIIRELVLSLAKVMLEHLRPYRLCGGVAACLGSGVCVVCCAEHTRQAQNTLPDDGRTPKHVGAIFV